MTADPPRTNLVIEYIRRPFTVVAFLGVVSGALIWRLFAFISRYSVNLLYSDQWAFYAPIFQDLGPWRLFGWQHGPHREGIGLIATAALANLTGWNSRGDAFAVGALVCLAMLCALLLKYQLSRAFTVVDAIIPFLFLTLFQYESFVVVPSLSYGAFPVLLIMLYCLGLCIKKPWIRCGILLILSFLLTYTGFGLFMGPLTILLFAMDIWQRRTKHQPVTLSAIGFVVALLSGLSFFISYGFDPAIPGFGFSLVYLAGYPVFVGLMLAAFWGWHTLLLGQLIPSVAGTVLLLTMAAILVYHGRRLARQGVYSPRTSLVIAVLIAFSLLFCLNTAIGRMPLGLRQAQVSRYLTLMIPGYLGVYFHLISMRPFKLRQLMLAAYLAMSVVGSLPIGIVEAQAGRDYENKENWKQCYFQFEDVEKCNQLTGWAIYPVASYILPKLEYLKAHHLNLYLDAAK